MTFEIDAAVASLERLSAQPGFLGPPLLARVQNACRYAHRRSEPSCCAVVVGDPAARAAFLDALLDARVFSGAPSPAQPGPQLLLRRAEQAGYRAIDAQGQTVDFQAPERATIDALTAELAAVPEHGTGISPAAAAAQVALARAEVSELHQKAELLRARVPAFVAVRPEWWAFWLWLPRLLLGWYFNRRNLELAGERTRLEQARSKLDAARLAEQHASLDDRHARLRATREALDQRFAQEVAALWSGADRSRTWRELQLDFPCPLPQGVTVIDAAGIVSPDGEARRRARQAVLEEADALIVALDPAAGSSPLLDELFEEVKHAFARFVPAAEVSAQPGALAELLKRERHANAAARVGSAAEACTRRFAALEAQTQEAGRQRIAQLEALRIERAEELKARQLQQAHEPSAQAASAVVEAARQALHGAVAGAAFNWQAQVRACESKDQLKLLVSELGKRPYDKSIVASALKLVEKTVWEGTTATVEKLAQPLAQQLAERTSAAQKLAGGAAATGNLPLDGPGGVRDAILFTDSGEAAAAAASAVFIGVLGGLFKGLDSLKEDCAQQVLAGAKALEQRLTEELLAAAPTITLGIESALATRLGLMLGNFERSLSGFHERAKQLSAGELERLAPLRALCAPLRQISP